MNCEPGYACRMTCHGRNYRAVFLRERAYNDGLHGGLLDSIRANEGKTLTKIRASSAARKKRRKTAKDKSGEAKKLTERYRRAQLFRLLRSFAWIPRRTDLRGLQGQRISCAARRCNLSFREIVHVCTWVRSVTWLLFPMSF